MKTKHLLEKHINERGSKPALVDSLGVSISWTTLGQMVQLQCGRMRGHDPSKPWVHRSENTVDDVIIAIAAACVGVIEAPLDHRITDDELQRRSEVLQKTVPGMDRFSGIVLWTSGTTDQPMGVLLSHECWLGNAAAKLAAVPQAAEDVRLTVLPLSHAYARTCDLGTWLLSGCTLAVALGMKGLQQLAPRVQPTLINAVPSIAYDLLSEDADQLGIGRLRLLGVGGAALSDDAFQSWKQRGVTVIQGYGLTESGPVICSATPGNATAGLVGDFVEGWEHQIRDGELFVRGDHQMQGYWNEPQVTEKKVSPDGWLRTGDLLERDSQHGQWRVLGRADDVIVLDNGAKIHPSAIEREVQQIPGVLHAVLCKVEALELWIDGDQIAPEIITRTVQKHWKFTQPTIHYFDPPLSRQAGELTAKATIRRGNISLHRFSQNG